MKKEIANDLNAYLANITVNYEKLHNLHWNVVGIPFKGVHEYLESLYDLFNDQLDAVAEFLKMNDVYPVASLREVLELATIEEIDSKDIPIKDALAVALADLKLIKEQAEAIHAKADEEGLYNVVMMLEDNLATYSKEIWFISAMLK